MYIAMLGRQPELGMAELERIYGPDNVSPLYDAGAALIYVDIEASALERLGGSFKLAKVLTNIDSTNWKAIEKYLASSIPQRIQHVPEGKFRLGLSVYGLNVSAETINITNLRLKKVIKATSRSIRVIPNKSPALNSAQVIHNHLTGPTGWELLIIRNGNRVILAQTIAEQDIDSYTARDQARPARDAFVGMLPPKLAQVMINLAVGQTQPTKEYEILDPFCGTGVVLQEALLMGYGATGADLSEKMIDYTTRNIDWLKSIYPKLTNIPTSAELGDATTATWKSAQKISAIASEAYLGQPFSAPPSPAKLEQVRGNCNHIISEFLKNAARQIEPGTPVCIAIPAWRNQDGGLSHLPLTQRLDQLGYSRVQFKHVDAKDLLYFRPDQIVARELLVLYRG